MFRVQFRDAANQDKILVNTLFLPYIPQDGKEVRLRRRFKDTRSTAYRVVSHLYEVIEEDPGQSGVVLLVTQVSSD